MTGTKNLKVQKSFSGFTSYSDKVNVILIGAVEKPWSKNFINIRDLTASVQKMLDKVKSLKEGIKTKMIDEPMTFGLKERLDPSQYDSWKIRVLEKFSQLLVLSGLSAVEASDKCEKNSDMILKCFTHHSYWKGDPSKISANYELDEHVGDAIMQLALKFYLVERERKLGRIATPDYLTKKKAQLLNKRYLSAVGNDKGIRIMQSRYQGLILAIGPVKSVSIVEDVVEAIFSAVYNITGGMERPVKLIEALFENYIEKSNMHIDEVYDILNKMYITDEPLEEESSEVEIVGIKKTIKMIRYRIKIKDSALDRMIGINTALLRDTWFEGTGKESFEAKDKASEALKKKMEEAGLTKDFAASVRFQAQLELLKNSGREEIVNEFKELVKDLKVTIFSRVEQGSNIGSARVKVEKIIVKNDNGKEFGGLRAYLDESNIGEEPYVIVKTAVDTLKEFFRRGINLNI
jgi:dsRNA-specific ribonuclease